jgi:hypothetical protein
MGSFAFGFIADIFGVRTSLCAGGGLCLVAATVYGRWAACEAGPAHAPPGHRPMSERRWSGVDRDAAKNVIAPVDPR